MVSEHCKITLGVPVNKERCLDFREVRRVALCNAWQLMEQERVSFSEAMKRSWDDLKNRCAELGVDSPETIEIEKSAKIIDKKTDQVVGIISLSKDDSVEVCIKDAPCYTTERGGERLYYLAQAYYYGLGFGIAPELDEGKE